jgi:hypothetical protein
MINLSQVDFLKQYLKFFIRTNTSLIDELDFDDYKKYISYFEFRCIQLSNNKPERYRLVIIENYLQKAEDYKKKYNKK